MLDLRHSLQADKWRGAIDPLFFQFFPGVQLAKLV